MKQPELLRDFILETVADVMKPEDVTWDVSKLTKDKGQVVNPYSPLEYSKIAAVNAARRGQKSLWNKYASHKDWNDPSKALIVHSLGYYSGNSKLWDYFGLKQKIVDYAMKELKMFKYELERHSDMVDVINKMPDDYFAGQNLPGINSPAKDELSCFGISINNKQKFDRMIERESVFTFKKYYVTFVSSQDQATERLSRAKLSDIKKYSQSGLPKRPEPRKEPAYSTYLTSPEEMKFAMGVGQEFGAAQEVVIDNWIVDTLYTRDSDNLRLAKMIGLNVQKK